MHTTMDDVARECGVTKKTVSRVFAGSASVKESTREKILHAAKQLNYEFNTLAQNFTDKRSRFIGVATPFDQIIGSSYFGEVFKGFGLAMNDTDMDVALFDTSSVSFDDGTKLARLYRQRRVDGLLVVALHTYDRFLDTLEQLHVPMVVVGEQPACNTVSSVSCNDQAGIEMLCAHLYSLGHRKIAFISGPPYVKTADRRREAYVDFCRSKGVEIPTEYIQPGNYSMLAGREAGRTLLNYVRPPTAIIAANDMMAFGVIETARQLNIRVPDQLSVAGFDDLPTAVERCPSLTTIRQPVHEMGERAAKILLESLRTGTIPTERIVMDVMLAIRESTAEPARS